MKKAVWSGAVATAVLLLVLHGLRAADGHRVNRGDRKCER